MGLSTTEYAHEEDSELLRLIKASKWDRVQDCLKDAGNQTSLPDVYGNLPLHAALGYRAPDRIILSVLQYHPDATKIHGTDDWLPLHIACMWGASPAVLEALIRSYPQALDDPGQGGLKGRTPRLFATKCSEEAQVLLRRSTEEWLELIRKDELANDVY